MRNAIVDAGIILIKVWLEVGKEEQEKRFAARIHDPLRQWKLSPMDVQSYNRWYDYSRAREHDVQSHKLKTCAVVRHPFGRQATRASQLGAFLLIARESSSTSSGLQNPITYSTPARLYHLRSKISSFSGGGEKPHVALEKHLGLFSVRRSGQSYHSKGSWRYPHGDRFNCAPLAAVSRPSEKFIWL